MSKKQDFKLVIKTGADTEEERERKRCREGQGKNGEDITRKKVCIYAEEQSGKNKTNFNKSEVE